MAQEAAETEPTMEEILASIRRIINEDDEAAPETPVAEASAPEPEAAEPEPEPASAAPEPESAPEPEPEDVLELTDRVEEPTGGTEPLAVDDDLMILDRDPEPKPEPAPPRAAAAPAPEPQPEPEPVMQQDEPLLDQTAAAAASGAFGALTNNLRVAASDGQTLEAIVRELMRPMLKEWLDANLPRIVEAKVEAEIERVARRS